MSAKRTRKDGQKASGKTPNEPSKIIVQRVSSEPDNKQTHKPIQPREFVPLEYKELTLACMPNKASGNVSLMNPINLS